MNPWHKKLILIFSVLSLIFFFIGFFSPESTDIHPMYKLGFGDACFIFLFNTINILIMFAISLLGISPIFLFKFIFGMGAGWQSVGGSPWLYYAASLIHGLLEWIVILIVFIFTIEHFQFLISYFMKKKNAEQLKKFYFKTCVRTVPLAVFILLISALVEVYISNRLLIFLSK
ncbi:stage II sporulation protein M [Paenibacillus alba]|uniref:stage II sporulation protein M n=1 Tax=Paenibacillus alba TaxID=1197127 RepID=UPI00398A8DF3